MRIFTKTVLPMFATFLAGQAAVAADVIAINCSGSGTIYDQAETTGKFSLVEAGDGDPFYSIANKNADGSFSYDYKGYGISIKFSAYPNQVEGVERGYTLYSVMKTDKGGQIVASVDESVSEKNLKEIVVSNVGNETVLVEADSTYKKSFGTLTARYANPKFIGAQIHWEDDKVEKMSQLKNEKGTVPVFVNVSCHIGKIVSSKK